MAFGTQYAMTMGATSSSCSVNLQRAFNSVYLLIPTMPSSTSFDVYGSADGTNYYQFRRSNVNTLTVQAATFGIAATAGANGGIVPLPGGFKYYKFMATDSTPTATVGFFVVCGNE